MSLNRREYVAHKTIITAENLNDIQAAIIDNENGIANLKTSKIVNYVGKDLSEKYTFAELHKLVAAGDFSDIEIGDYYPIMLNGTYYDAATETAKTISNEKVFLEVAAINPYIGTGDTELTKPHIAFVSRDCLANTVQMRSENSTWYNADENTPWLGSAAYATLNDADNGIIKLVENVVGDSYIFNMRYIAETMAAGASSPTTWSWKNRGKLWLPTESEVYGRSVWQANGFACGINYNQLPIFAGSTRHIVKHSGNGGARCHWWLATAASASNFCVVYNNGYADYSGAANARRVPL
jgi:hypothetical protein